MWLLGAHHRESLGDITVGDSIDETPVPAIAPPSETASLINLAANVVSAVQPYKQGVPVNVAIAPQTQSFLMMGGFLLAGLFVLNLVRR